MYASHTYTFEIDSNADFEQMIELWGERVVRVENDLRQLVVSTPSLHDSLFWSLYGITKPLSTAAAYSGRRYGELN